MGVLAQMSDGAGHGDHEDDVPIMAEEEHHEEDMEHHDDMGECDAGQVEPLLQICLTFQENRQQY